MQKYWKPLKWQLKDEITIYWTQFSWFQMLRKCHIIEENGEKLEINNNCENPNPQYVHIFGTLISLFR